MLVLFSILIESLKDDVLSLTHDNRKCAFCILGQYSAEQFDAQIFGQSVLLRLLVMEIWVSWNIKKEKGLSFYRPFPHFCKERHQLEARVNKIQWVIWNCPPEPRPHFFMFVHWTVMRERSIDVRRMPLLELRIKRRKTRQCWAKIKKKQNVRSATCHNANSNGSKGCAKLCIGCKTMLKQGH